MIRKEDIFLYVWFKWLLLKEWCYIMNLLIGNLNYMKIKLNVLFLEINLKKILYNKDIMRKCILFLNTKKKEKYHKFSIKNKTGNVLFLKLKELNLVLLIVMKIIIWV